MAAQLKDKGHPTLQAVSAERFATVLENCKRAPKPSAQLLKLVAKGRASLQ